MKHELAMVDSKGNRSHWGLFLDGVDAVFKSAKLLRISSLPIIECFDIDFDDHEKYDDTINDTLLTQMMDQIVKWVAPDVSDLNCKISFFYTFFVHYNNCSVRHFFAQK